MLSSLVSSISSISRLQKKVGSYKCIHPQDYRLTQVRYDVSRALDEIAYRFSSLDPVRLLSLCDSSIPFERVG